MVCHFCGYEYADDLLRCPHCGAENVREAREQQQEALDALEEEKKAIRLEPGRIFRRTDRAAARIGLWIFAGAVLLAVFTAAGSFLWRLWQRHTLAENVKKLETCLAEQDYGSLCELLDRIDSYDPAYDPYYPVGYAYDDLIRAGDDLEWFRSDLESGLAEDPYLAQDLAFALNDAMNAYIQSGNGLYDGLYLGNEDALQDIHDQAYRILTEDLRMTDEEIEEMAGLYLQEDTDVLYDSSLFLPHAFLSFERLEQMP